MKLGYFCTSTVLSFLANGGDASDASDKVPTTKLRRNLPNEQPPFETQAAMAKAMEMTSNNGDESASDLMAKTSKSTRNKMTKNNGDESTSKLINPDCELNYDETYKATCEGFCAEFFEECVNPNYFSAKMSWDECMHTCTAWPRTKTTVTRPPEKFYNLQSDTYACRDLHLWEAKKSDSPTDAAFHCYHSVADGAHICHDIDIGGKNPFETLRDSACTHHHYGYCDLSGGGIGKETVADCMKAGLTDDNLADALRMMPPTIEYLFVQENEGITMLPSGVFNNLANPSALKAVYFEDCNIANIDEDAFHPLVNLESLSLSFNKIEVLQDDLLNLPKLRAFYLTGNPAAALGGAGSGGGYKPGLLTSDGFTSEVFQKTPNLEKLIVYAHPGITQLHDGMFEGLSSINTFFFLALGLDNDSFSDDIFKPLVSVEYFDMFANKFTELNPAWFGDWSQNIVRLCLFANDFGPLTDPSIFAGMPNLQHVYLDKNPRLKYIPPEYFANNPELNMVTIGPLGGK